MSLMTDERGTASAIADTPAGVRAYTLEGSPLPLVLEPTTDGIDLAEWNLKNREWIEAQLLVHGGVLFRNFTLPSPADFERAAKAIYGELFGDYGDLPKNAAGEKIYESTPYPPDQMILYHNESSHLPSWPRKISFHCVIPAKAGGCTPVFDTRAALKHIDPAVLNEVRTKGLMYVRNFSKGVDPTWEAFFHTTDKATVEQMCRDAGSDFEWKSDGGLRVINRSKGIVKHPKTKEEMFFNQVQIHHIYCVDEDTREGLRALFDDQDLPRNVYYGDGSPIPDETMQHLGEVFEKIAVRFKWQKGDMIMLDNMLVTHARDSFEGPRHIVVAMGQMISADELPV
ncbi:MAG: Taurine catabolism dioxygenase TauD/TfdA [Gemmatimonadetes bacterium]|jgi:alpha-ketoglutarate-dependent taurine dioxygenase|nr:Taurine catabolism dioxygenase TauD/TfdA [Gemmatimonadota bacterium]